MEAQRKQTKQSNGLVTNYTSRPMKWSRDAEPPGEGRLLSDPAQSEEPVDYGDLERSLNSGKSCWRQLEETKRRVASKREAAAVMELFCEGGMTNLLQMALRERPELVSAVFDDLSRPLHVAARRGHCGAVRLLLSAGAEVEQRGRGRTPLQEAVACGQLEVARVLLKAGAEVNGRGGCRWTPLQMAAAIGNSVMARLLCDAGADVHAGDGWCDKPLLLAVKCGSLRTVDVLLLYGVRMYHQVRGALVWAAENGADRAVVRLAYAAAYPGPKPGPLLLAVRYCGEEAVRALVEAGADLKEVDADGCSALHWAAMRGNAAVVRLLLRGSDINAADKFGFTPLHHSAVRGNADATRLLVWYGADITARNFKDLTAMDLAKRCGHSEVTWFLRSRIATLKL